MAFYRCWRCAPRRAIKDASFLFGFSGITAVLLSQAVALFVRAWRSVGVFAAALLAVWYFVDQVQQNCALSDWFFFDLLRLWGWVLVLSLSCVGAGLRLLEWLDRQERPLLERLALAFPLGLVAFGMGLFGLGFLRLFRPWVSVVWPCALLLAGGGPLLRLRRELSGALPALPQTAAQRAFVVLLTMAGACAVGVLYLGILPPDAVNYDATWTHLTVAQDYARVGRVIPFYGNWVKNVPHFASVLYTWAFLLPGFELPTLRWMMALHIEFAAFLWTLVGIAAGINFVSGRRVRAGWTALFLFPGIFVYDSNMGAAADHVLALFVVPLLLLTVAVLKNFEWRASLLFAVVAGGALFTKLQAVYVLGPLALVATFRLAWLFFRPAHRGARLRLVAGWLLMGGGALAIMAPHMDRNFAAFGNPLFPMLQSVWPSRQQGIPADAAQQFHHLFTDWHWRPTGTFMEKVKHALGVMLTFSFVPHYSFERNLPVFGSLFTLSAPLVAFFGRQRRLWFVMWVAWAALFCWAMTYLVDRNLQTFLPAMVVVTGSVFALAWQQGKLARAGVVALVVAQLAWGGDAYFSGKDRIMAALAVIRSGGEGRAAQRYASVREPYLQVGRDLPRRAVVMLHNHHPSLGIDRKVVLDWAGYQGLIDYRRYGNAYDLWQRLRELKVTHVVYVPGQRAAPSKQEEVIFHLFAKKYGAQVAHHSFLKVFALPKESLPETADYKVLLAGVPWWQDGLYSVRDLATNEEYPPEFITRAAPRKVSPDLPSLLDEADVALVGDSKPEIYQALSVSFERLGYVPGFQVFARKSLTTPGQN